MGYINQIRQHPNIPRGKTWEPVYVPPWVTRQIDTDPKGTPLDAGLMNSTEETYSYRTGRLAETQEDSQEAALLSSQNQAAVFSHLNEEYVQSPQSPFDTGHAFKTTKKLAVLTPSFDERWQTYGYDYRYVGPVYTSPIGGTYLSLPVDNPTYYGTRAIGNCAPTNGYLDLAVTLAELKREGFPRMGEALSNGIARGVDIQKSLGIGSKEYLAWEFGMKPLLSDYLKSIRTFADYRTRMNDFVQGSGKLLHRTYTFPIERTSTTYPAASGYLTPLSPSSSASGMFVGSSTGTCLRSSVTTVSRYFSGAFTYYYPEGESLLALGKQAESLLNQLVGSRVGADVMWNLAPWSWLSDWHNNIGQNIANAEMFAQDGLVMKYGYLMTETQVDHELATYGPRTRSGFTGPYKTIWRHTVKERVKASPFGFALNPSSFTNRQWAILGALGYTKAPGILP